MVGLFINFLDDFLYSWFKKPPPQILSKRSNPFPDDMVKLPPERRKLSVLPYIINEFTLNNSDDGEYDELGNSCNSCYQYEDEGVVVLGKDIGGVDEETSKHWGM